MERSDLRAADVDPRRVADELQRHYVDGRLSSDELSERVSQALAARTFGELDTLRHDLPPLPPPAAPTLAGGDEAPSSSPDSDQGHAGPRTRRDVRAHAISYAMVMALLMAIWLLTSPGGYFWPVWPMLGWGFGLASHALARGGWRVGPRPELHERDRRR